MFDLFDPITIPATLRVRVTPRAKQAQIKRETQADGTPIYRIHVTAVAEDGKANAAVIAALAEALAVPKSHLTITHGLTSRDKIIAYRG